MVLQRKKKFRLLGNLDLDPDMEEAKKTFEEGDLLLKGCDPSKFGEERNNFLKILSCPCSLRAADWRPPPTFVERRICPKLERPWPLGARENTIAATKITSKK